MGRRITAAEMNDLSARGLTDRQFRRAVYALERGADALRLLDLQTRRDVTAKLYRDALDAAVMRSADGSLQPEAALAAVQAATDKALGK